MDDVKDITPIENRNAIQVLTDVAMTDPDQVVVLYVGQDGTITMQSNGVPLSKINLMLDICKQSILEM